MSKKKKRRTQRTKDYFPVTNPAELDENTNVSLPSEEDIEQAKAWVDDTGK